MHSPRYGPTLQIQYCTSDGQRSKVTLGLPCFYRVVFSALTAEFNIDPTVTDHEASEQYFDQGKFESVVVYFVTGGRSRRFREFYQHEIDTSSADQVVARTSKQQVSLSLSHSREIE